jgi:uncharacterized repeat protein (TIGR01451 family)
MIRFSRIGRVSGTIFTRRLIPIVVFLLLAVALLLWLYQDNAKIPSDVPTRGRPGATHPESDPDIHKPMGNLAADTDYRAFVSAMIYGGSFSTDVTNALPDINSRQPQLSALIINNTQCAAPGRLSTYRLVVRNTGKGGAKDITMQSSYPVGTSFQQSLYPPDDHNAGQRALSWHIAGPLPPADFLIYDFTVEMQESRTLANTLLVSYSDMKLDHRYQTITDHTIEPC